MYGNMLALNGNAETVSLQLSFSGINLSVPETAELLDFIVSHKSLLEKGETAQRKVLYSVLTKGRKRDVYYFLDVKMFTFALAVWLSGKFENRLEELLYSIIYLPPERIIRLDENNGEVCLTRQAVLKNGKCATREIFVKNNGLCVNTELDCKFRDGEKCGCRKADAEDVIWELARKNVFIETKGTFRLNW